MRTNKGPQSCFLSRKADKGSTLFAGVYINVSALARMMRLDQSYLSRIFSGERQPSLAHAMKIAAGLGMGLESFTEALAERIKAIEEQRQQNTARYQSRIEQEDAEDQKRQKAGKPVVRRLSAFRVAS